MMSPIRILTRAKWIMEHKQFCNYNDDRFPMRYAIARRADGESTAPENKPAVMFTLTGAVAKAVHDLSDETWVDRHSDYVSAMTPLWSKVSLNQSRFLRMCDQMGKEKCISLLDEVLEL